MRTIEKIGKNTTTIIVAHRLSTIKDCDNIFVLKDGKVIESGSHKELLERNGIYTQMWKSQNQTEHTLQVGETE